jgi:hypothetical protein
MGGGWREKTEEQREINGCREKEWVAGSGWRVAGGGRKRKATEKEWVVGENERVAGGWRELMIRKLDKTLPLMARM